MLSGVAKNFELSALPERGRDLSKISLKGENNGRSGNGRDVDSGGFHTGGVFEAAP
jgi:hypothetical protein